jgi:hypothetical protein
MEHNMTGDVVRRREIGELRGAGWAHARGMERSDGGRAVRHRWERADGVVIFVVREAASG